MQTCTHLVTGDLLILSGSSVTLKKKTNVHVSNRWVLLAALVAVQTTLNTTHSLVLEQHTLTTRLYGCTATTRPNKQHNKWREQTNVKGRLNCFLCHSFVSEIYNNLVVFTL